MTESTDGQRTLITQGETVSEATVNAPEAVKEPDAGDRYHLHNPRLFINGVPLEQILRRHERREM